MKKFALALLFAAAAPAWAGVQLLTPVEYAAESSVVPKVREACKVEARLATDVGAALGGTTTDATQGDVVKVSIVDVMGVGGGAWSGPKAISIRVDLLKDGKPVRTTHLTRTTTGGAFGGFKGTCSMLERDSAVLGKDVAKWVASESYTTGEDGRK